MSVRIKNCEKKQHLLVICNCLSKEENLNINYSCLRTYNQLYTEAAIPFRYNIDASIIHPCINSVCLVTFVFVIFSKIYYTVSL